MSQYAKTLKEEFKRYKKEFKEISSLIEKYQHIAIFRHIRPDFDALGAQFGFAYFLKKNYPEKDIKILGDNHSLLAGSVFPETDKVNESWFKENDFLALIVDTANKSRIADPRYSYASKIIKIDHHPNLEPFGDINLVDKDRIAASEIIATLLLAKKGMDIDATIAKYLYIGIVGDSGRFQYEGTSCLTFDLASILLSYGFSLPEATQGMYAKPLIELDITKFVLNNYKLSPKNVAYYILTNDDLKRFDLTVERGKDSLFIFNNIEPIPIWFSVTQDVTDHCYRISLRSKKIPINKVGEKYHGGGHPLSSGAKIKHLSELEAIIKDLDNLIQ